MEFYIGCKGGVFLKNFKEVEQRKRFTVRLKIADTSHVIGFEVFGIFVNRKLVLGECKILFSFSEVKCIALTCQQIGFNNRILSESAPGNAQANNQYEEKSAHCFGSYRHVFF